MEGLEGSRTAAMTVVFGRERKVAMRALPMPEGELCWLLCNVQSFKLRSRIYTPLFGPVIKST